MCSSDLWSIQLGSKTQNQIEVGNYYSLDFANQMGDNIPFKGIENPHSDARLKMTLKADGLSDIPTKLPESGVISDVETRNEYYNIQGIKIASPTHGIYILRNNRTTKKIYVR